MLPDDAATVNLRFPEAPTSKFPVESRVPVTLAPAAATVMTVAAVDTPMLAPVKRTLSTSTCPFVLVMARPLVAVLCVCVIAAVALVINTLSCKVGSVNYAIGQYAGVVAGVFSAAAREHDLPMPDLMTESGRALTAHHAVLVTNVIDSEQVLCDPAGAVRCGLRSGDFGVQHGLRGGPAPDAGRLGA